MWIVLCCWVVADDVEDDLGCCAGEVGVSAAVAADEVAASYDGGGVLGWIGSELITVLTFFSRLCK